MALKQIVKKIIPEKIWNGAHWLLALLGALIYFFPSKDMMVVGVTGTNGKSTVVEILHRIFKDFGFKVSSYSSLRSKIIDKEEINLMKMTMPGRFLLQKFLAASRNQGCQIVILEVTSEGIKQYRDVGIRFDVALITNLRPEHIESHGSFENYRAAKGKLFKRLSRKKPGIKSASIVNLDDPSAFYYTHFYADEKYGFGLNRENNRADVKFIIPKNVVSSQSGFSFSYAGIEWQSSLLGEFNLYNVLSTIAVAERFKLPLDGVRKSIYKIKGIPGRMELVQTTPFKVVVDYAHTPDALEKVLRSARLFWAHGAKSKVISVFGSAGGGRDSWKRPELGKIADQLADFIILTNEDPYKENPENILNDIERGIKNTKYTKIMARNEAIAYAMAQAKNGDVVVITGKGAEQMIMTESGPIEWDDRKVVKKISKKL